MRNQMKFYLALLAVILLQGTIFSVSLKESESLKANLEAGSKTETENKTELKDPGNHDLDDLNNVGCLNDIPESGLVSQNNPPTTDGTQICTTNCRHPSQFVFPNYTRIGNCGRDKFNDVGVNSEGVIVAIGTDGKLYLYQFDLNIFEEIQGDFRLHNLRRVDIGYDGLIYVVNYSGDTYYLSCNRYWVKLPGCAIDISAGRGHEVNKIGCNDYCDPLGSHACNLPSESNPNPCPIENESPYTYKLICKCDCRCCRRKCNLFVKYTLCDCKKKDIDRECYWLKYPNGPVYYDVTWKLCTFSRIDTHNSGYPTVIGQCNNVNKLWQFIGSGVNRYTELRSGNRKFRDVCSDNLGNIFYILNNTPIASTSLATIYIYRTGNSSDGFVTANSVGYNLSCGPYAQVTYTEDNCCMKTNSKIWH
jgi:hypothetical protein